MTDNNSPSPNINILEDWNLFLSNIWEDNARPDCYAKSTGPFWDSKLSEGLGYTDTADKNKEDKQE